MKILGFCGRLLFACMICMFGLGHMVAANSLAFLVPFGGVTIIYFTGICLMAAAVSVAFGIYAKQGSILLGVLLICFALLYHLPSMNHTTDPVWRADHLTHLLKNLALAGAAFYFADSLDRKKKSGRFSDRNEEEE